MDVPRRLVEEAAELMRQQRGNEALNRLRNHNITTFSQLENLCRLMGVETWKAKEEVDVHKNAPDYFDR
ncbi:MAG: hypothetical protein HY318_09795 [Armatimonadetes bacterium]|nr:hypothetical protein [Armatimonadota bacterium]